MPRKTPKKTVEKIRELYQQGLSISEIARQTKVSTPTVFGYTKAHELGFESPSEYRLHLIKQLGFKTLSEYNEYLAKRRGFKSINEYKEHQARKKGFASAHEYKKHLARQKQQSPEAQELSDLIKKRLEELEKNQSWLAQQLNLSRESVSLYAQGKTLPNQKNFQKLCSALKLPYQTLDELLDSKTF